MLSGAQSDILLRLCRWRQRLERGGTGDREAKARRETVGRTISEIETLRRRVEKLQDERQTLEAIVLGPRGLTR
jgi:transposase-like protein